MARDKTFPLKLSQVVLPHSKPEKKHKQQADLPSFAQPKVALSRSNTIKNNTYLQQACTKPIVSGLGLDSERARLALVERLRTGGISDVSVLNAIATIPRHLFVDEGFASQAYEDAALPIGYEQTISKPSIVARMIQLLRQGKPSGELFSKILEIGTGCGYQAAILSQLACEVYSIERVKQLFEKSKNHLHPLRLANVRLHYGDGKLGLPQVAPFDAIILAAAGLEVPQALLNQLAIGGKLIAPIVKEQGQALKMIVRHTQTVFHEVTLEAVLFVPLKSGTA